MENLMNTSSDMLQAVSDFLGVTVEYFQANGQELLVNFAWYSFLKDIPTLFFDFVFIYLFVSLILGLALFALSDLEFIVIKPKPVAICYIVCAIAVFLGVFVAAILPVLVAPEFVGLENIYNLIGGN